MKPNTNKDARGGSMQPQTRIRKLADGLIDMERYSSVKRQRRPTEKRNRRAESSGGYHTIQEPTEIITSMNMKDYRSSVGGGGYDRSPTISPSTIRVR